jgi:cell division protein FtsN
MPRDYAKDKQNAQHKRANKSKKSVWKLWLILVLSVIALIIYFFPSNKRDTSLTVKPEVKKTILVSVKSQPQPKTKQQPQFDFYTVLSKEPANPINKSANNNTTEYVLQVATTNNSDETERIKSELGLLGFSAFIDGKHVVIGPYYSSDAAKDDQKKLQASNINSILYKLDKK